MASAEGTFFVSLHLSSQDELWRSDGTAAGTSRVTVSPDLRQLAAAGRRLFFTASTPETGTELWKTDGTPEGTSQVADLTPGAASTPFGAFAALGETLFFTAGDTHVGFSLWKSDGTAGGTSVIKSFTPGLEARGLNAVNGRLVLSFASVDTDGGELWASDGTQDGTVLLSDARLIGAVAETQGRLYLGGPVVNGAPSKLWKTDGTPEGTSELERTFFFGNSIVRCCSLENVEHVGAAGKIFLRQSFQSWPGGPQPSPERTYSLREFNPEDQQPEAEISGGVNAIASVNDQFLVSASETAFFWRRASDGMGGQVELPSTVRSPIRLFPSGEHLFFVPDDGVIGDEVWATHLACMTDHTPPQIQCPERVAVETTNSEGAAVSYPPATATDDQSSELEITYSEPSGSVFPIGVTTVTARTQDEAEQAAFCTFEVEVRKKAGSCGCTTPLVSALPWGALLLLVPLAARRRGA
ncbi:HYR domain-containing protein [Hyalangium versicolor]|uniref:HYR domain-containing protein n=1 Tax=Hyalangium versicolor TaxID=2861190 RepID=UPI001CCC62F5|nr:HYR domain-containing protein [Hyalangium versicolor]